MKLKALLTAFGVVFGTILGILGFVIVLAKVPYIWAVVVGFALAAAVYGVYLGECDKESGSERPK